MTDGTPDGGLRDVILGRELRKGDSVPTERMGTLNGNNQSFLTQRTERPLFLSTSDSTTRAVWLAYKSSLSSLMYQK
jgi:hypothetical protein